MWQIKDVKRVGKQNFKKNMWTFLLLTIFMTLVVGEYIITKDGASNIEVLDNFIKDRKESKQIEFFDKDNPNVIINEYLDKSLSQLFTGNMTGIIKQYNEKHNVTKGVIFTIFNVFTNGQMQLQNLVNSILNYTEQTYIKELIVVMIALSALGIKVFISNPILIGESRIYLENINYKKTKIRRLLFPFKKERYLSIVSGILLMKVYKFLWNLTIVGGIIKSYSYKMVPYIIAENPKIKAKDAIKMSREMMNGNKMKSFKLDLTFIGWIILEYVTFGIAGLYVNGYYKATYTELYRILREDYIEKEKYNYELLNDELLYNRKLLANKFENLTQDEIEGIQKYPDKYELERKKTRIDYNKKYEISSLILFFFIFSFVGWIWEVGLYIFKYGIFVNRGTLYGPWLPIYGAGCTLIILLTRFREFRKTLKNPFATFFIVMGLCTIIEYLTSWYLEATMGLRYWDYTGIFLNINGRVCLECSIFFGLGGCICVYFVAPFLEKFIQKIDRKKKIAVCTLLVTLFCADQVYSKFNPHMGEGITNEVVKKFPIRDVSFGEKKKPKY